MGAIYNSIQSPYFPVPQTGIANYSSGYSSGLSSLGLIGQLLQTPVDPRTGIPQFNVVLIQNIVSMGEQAITPLAQYLSTLIAQSGGGQNRQLDVPIVAGLLTAQRMAENNVPGVEDLYATISNLNGTRNPLIQIYLSGFYRALNQPHTFGPTLDMFIRNTQQPPVTSTFQNPQEELGGTLLQQIANRAADETMRRLTPYLNPPR